MQRAWVRESWVGWGCDLEMIGDILFLFAQNILF